MYTNQKHNENCFLELHKFYLSNQFTDIKIICNPINDEGSIDNNNEILCHKIVLASFSTYFYAMFTSNLLETQTNQVNMKSFDKKTLNEVINYAYSGCIYLNTNNVQNILSIASLLQIAELQDACEDYMESQLDTQNCLYVYYFACLHNCLKLKQKSKEYLDKYFMSIINTDEFLSIDDVVKICELLNSDDLNITKEEFLIKSILKWINYDYETRCRYTERLLNCIRFSLIDSFNDLEEVFGEFVENCDSQRYLVFVKTLDRFYTERNSFLDKKRAG